MFSCPIRTRSVLIWFPLPPVTWCKHWVSVHWWDGKILFYVYMLWWCRDRLLLFLWCLAHDVLCAGSQSLAFKTSRFNNWTIMCVWNLYIYLHMRCNHWTQNLNIFFKQWKMADSSLPYINSEEWSIILDTLPLSYQTLRRNSLFAFLIISTIGIACIPLFKALF